MKVSINCDTMISQVFAEIKKAFLDNFEEGNLINQTKTLGLNLNMSPMLNGFMKTFVIQ